MIDTRSYSSAFQRFFTALLLDEGPESNDPRDPGGRTKFGLSQRAYPHYNFDELTVDDAREIYYQDYWCKIYGDSLPDPIAGVMFDCAVNQGVKACIKISQRAVKVSDDGVLGLATRQAIESSNVARFVERFTTFRVLYYKESKGFDVYGVGWISRAIRTAIRVSR